MLKTAITPTEITNVTATHVNNAPLSTEIRSEHLQINNIGVKTLVTTMIIITIIN